MENLRVVCVGGGLGAPTVMAGLRAYTDDITGLIAVTDSGRSPGKVRLRYLEATDEERAAIDNLGVRVVHAPVIDKWSGPRELWNKQDTLRYDSRRVAAALVRLLSERRPQLRAVP